MLPAAGAALLAPILQLLQGISAAADSWQEGATRAHEAAVQALAFLLALLDQVRSGAHGAASRLLPHVALGAELANRFINGRHCTVSSGGCCCCLATSAGGEASAAPVLSLRRAHRPFPLLGDPRTAMPTGAMVIGVLSPLRYLQQAYFLRPADHSCLRLIASRGGLFLELQHMALGLLQARQLRAGGAQERGRSSRSRPGRGSSSASAGSRGRGGGGSSTSAGGSISSCAADLAFFLGPQDAAPFRQVLQQPAEELAEWAEGVLATMRAMGSLGSDSDCPRCAPQQLLLVLEAATIYPPAAASRFDAAHTAIMNLSGLMLAADSSRRPWQPAFMQRAVPTLSAWVLAAARSLPTAEGAATFQQTHAVLASVAVPLLVQGGLLHSPEAHRQAAAPLEHLLAAAERALRLFPPSERAKAWSMGLVIPMVSCGPTGPGGGGDRPWPTGPWGAGETGPGPQGPGGGQAPASPPAEHRRGAVPPPRMLTHTPLLRRRSSLTAPAALTSCGAAERCPACWSAWARWVGAMTSQP